VRNDSFKRDASLKTVRNYRSPQVRPVRIFRIFGDGASACRCGCNLTCDRMTLVFQMREIG